MPVYILWGASKHSTFSCYLVPYESLLSVSWVLCGYASLIDDAGRTSLLTGHNVRTSFVRKCVEIGRKMSDVRPLAEALLPFCDS